MAALVNELHTIKERLHAKTASVSREYPAATSDNGQGVPEIALVPLAHQLRETNRALQYLLADLTMLADTIQL